MSRKLAPKECLCSVCGKTFIYSRDKRGGSTTTRCGKCGVQKWRKAKKLKAIEYKGGKCEICGYSKCIWALEFHHINPELKLFEIGNNTFSWEKNQKELDKCILVCANCHREIESAGFI